MVLFPESVAWQKSIINKGRCHLILDGSALIFGYKTDVSRRRR